MTLLVTPSYAEWGNTDRPNGVTGNVLYRAAAFSSGGPDSIVAVGRAWTGNQYYGLVASHLFSGGWHNGSFTLGSGWYPGQQFYDFAGAGYDTLCNAVTYVIDGFIVACRSMKANGYYDTYLLKLDSSGNKMARFGANGIVTTGIGGNTTDGHSFVRGIAYNSDLGIVTITGGLGKYSPSVFHPFIASYDQITGEQYGTTTSISGLDGTAVGLTYISTGAGYAVAATQTSATHQFKVYQYIHNGSTPTTLDAGWTRTVDFSGAGGGTESVPSAITLVGSSVVVVGANKVNSATPPWRCAAVMINNSDGTLNTGFGKVTLTGGTDNLGISLFSHDGATPDDDCILNRVSYSTSIYVGGTAYVSGNTNYDTYFAKMGTDGILTSAFGTSGQKTAAVGAADDVINDILVSGSSVYAVGRVQNAGLYNGSHIHKLDTTDGALSKTVSSIAVAPATTSMVVGQAATPTVTVTYSDTSTATPPASSFVWSASDSGKVSPTAAGIAQGVAAGSSTVTAGLGSGGTSGTSSSITVTDGQAVFVTSGTYTGAFGSVSVADFTCQLEAVNAGLPGIWRAILSTSATDASSRITMSSPPYNTRTAGAQRVAVNSSDFWANVYDRGIEYNATGASQSNAVVWTGTNANGTKASTYMCSDWASTSGTGAYGFLTATNSTLIYSSNSENCSTPYQIYCINNQSAAAAPPDPASFTKTSAGKTDATFSISSGGGTTGGYRMAYQTGGTAPASCILGTQISAYTIGARATTYTLTNLIAGTQYSFRLCATNSDQSAYSSGLTLTFTTPSSDLRIFVTSGTYNAAFGSVYVADLSCQIEANSAGLSGTWFAILSTSGVDASSRITMTQPPYDMRKSVVGGMRKISNSSTTFWANTYNVGISYDATGTSQSNAVVWTGTNADGTKASTYMCSDWASTSGTGAYGFLTATNSTLIYSSNSENCSTPYQIYCINNQSAAAAPPDPASFTQANAGKTRANFTFSSGGGTTAGYRIAYQTGGTAPASCVLGTQISAYTIGTRKTTYTVTGLSASTEYSFRLCAANSDQSAYSTGLTLTFTTPATDQQVFVTSGTFTGNFGGVYVADLSCQIEANTAGLSGTWKAILSTSSTNASSRISITQPVYDLRAGGAGGPRLISETSTSFWANTYNVGISYDATGTSQSNAVVWTGTNADGTKASTYMCSDWASTSGTGAYGFLTATNSTLIYSSNSENCSTPYQIYCINNQSAAAAPPDPASFTQANAGKTRANFTFSSGGGTTAGYRIAYQTGGTAPASCVLGTQISAYTIGTRKTTYTVTGLSASTEYSFRLCAANSDQSAYSAGLTLTFTTPATDQQVFVTSGTFTGNFGGVAGADSQCATEATNAGLSGTWKAILSTSASNASSRISITQPVYDLRAGGAGGPRLISETSTSFWANTYNVGISYDATGTSQSNAVVWTGTNADGTKASTYMCSDWASTSGTGAYGLLTATNSTLIYSSNSENCSSPYQIYCINLQ